MPEIHGEVASGWEPVRAAFEANYEIDVDPLAPMLGGSPREIGAAFSLYHRGEKVVDLWGGLADATTGREWDERTLALVFSTTKGATAICANLLAQRGELDLDAPVVDYWPEFGKHGKDTIPVRYLLCHKSGLPYVEDTMTHEEMLQWDPVVEALENMAPVWEPGSQHGYHAVTYGWLVGEVIKRVSGKSIGRFFQDEVAGPLGLDFWIGTPDEHHGRVALLETFPMPDDPTIKAMVDQFIGPETLLGRTLAAPVEEVEQDRYNHPDTWRAEIPAANGICDARSLAKMYGACVGEVDGVRLLSDEQVAKAIEPQTEGPDTVIMNMELNYGLGFMLPSPIMPLGNDRNFGHFGAGGSMGMADPDHQIGFGYIMNKMFLGLTGDPRTTNLINAVYACLG